mmetsp:Transcript_30563/g.62456  ORF Transcript_30563/g.62456 Transcript_30563/m.62456 type:complete len:81 (+) Transcript_30563:70-312(+)
MFSIMNDHSFIPTCRKLASYATFDLVNIRNDPLGYYVTNSESSQCTKTDLDQYSKEISSKASSIVNGDDDNFHQSIRPRL